MIGPEDGDQLTVGTTLGAGGEAFDLAVDPLEGRGVVARGGNGAMSMIAVGPPGSLLRLPDMYMRRMAVGPRARGEDRPDATCGRERRRDRRGASAATSTTSRARARPPSPPRPDRGDPRRRRPDQADPGRRRDRIDLGRDPRHERPPCDRDRRHPAGGAVGSGAPLSRRRAAGAALADHARRDRGCRRHGVEDVNRVFTSRGSRTRRGDRRRDRASPTATSCAASASSPTAPARTRS